MLADKTLSLEELKDMPDDEVIEKLDEIKGIGTWTAKMFLMFSLGRVDVFPYEDLGVRNAIQKAYRLRKPPNKRRLDQLSSKWKPYRSVASLYLWRSMEKKDW